ncbi:MAG: carboxypeptidase-like regulatory domain-containing protein, partial [Candidatus Hydrogenedentales bacterium]
MKTLVALLVIAILAGVCASVDRIYRPDAPSTDVLVKTIIDAAASLEADKGETGSISGRVVDARITPQIWMMYMEKRGSPGEEDVLESLLAPRPGVEIVLGEFKDGGIGRRLRSARTNNAGRFSFGKIPPGRYALRLVPPPEACPAHDGKPDNFKHVEVKAGEDTTAEFRIQNGISIRGHVTDTAGRPVSGAH